ncbi:MAG: hypothetical protein H7329_03345 [Opitutaceae bacterium]|nr:hypothetical protein [Cytophagales bacterium]
MNEKDLNIKIESYLNRNMPDDEIIGFESEISQNQTLADKVETFRLANLALTRNKLWVVKNISNAINDEHIKASKIKKTVLILSALTLLGIGIASAILIKEEKPNEIIKSNSKISKVETTKTENKQAITQNLQTKKTNKPARKELQNLVRPTKIKENNIVYTPAEVENKTVVPQKTADISKSMIPAYKQKPEDSRPDNICRTISIDAFISAEKACFNEQNGRISVSGFKGGSEPYIYKVLDQAKQNISSTKLAAGIYSVIITDSRNCQKLIEGIIIKEENCKRDLELNASNGDEVEFGTADQEVSFTVYDKGGNIYFDGQFASGEKIKWNGISAKGEIKSGYFIFTLKYQDGKIHKGSITVIK